MKFLLHLNYVAAVKCGLTESLLKMLLLRDLSEL